MSVIMRNDIEVGGTDDDMMAKVGTAQLTTTSKDLSGAVNELNSSLATKLNANLVQFFPPPTRGTNLNTLTSAGIAIYQIGNITQYTNAPTGKGTTGVLIVTRVSSYIVQRFYSNSTFTYRSSYDGGSGWNNWI